MPGNSQALLLLLLFIVPGFVFVEIDARRRPAQRLGTFDKTVLSIFFSTILHGVLLWTILIGLLLVSRIIDLNLDLSRIFDENWAFDKIQGNPLSAFALTCSYFVISVGIAAFCGFAVGGVTGNWTPVLSHIVRRNQANAVLVQMKNGDFYTGILDRIPADYEILQGPAKDFTMKPPGRYKPKDKAWEDLQENEIVLLNTTNVDAIRIIPQNLRRHTSARS